MEIYVKWTGTYPCLCSGKWILKVDGNDYSNLLKGKGEMNTYGTYPRWYFNEEYSEEWDYYTDGLVFSEWKQENVDWLSKITNDEDVWEEIFDAISEEDWRHLSCGGCI